MNALILAAGYATRLYPLTLHQAKPLLPVANRPMIQWVLQQLAPIPDLQTVYIVTNHKFAENFERWKTGFDYERPISILDDGSSSDQDKLGAIGDIHFALDAAKLDQDSLIVVAGDNLLSESLVDFAKFAQQHTATLGVYDVRDLALARKYNELTVNPAGILTDFEEKPENPQSTICGIALYHYSPEALKLLRNYLAEGNNPDQPGRFVQWLHKRVDVFTFPISGIWYDIGSHETLAEANRLFAGMAAGGPG